MMKMGSKGGTGQACAACKYQRRKCNSDCPLAPYFPPDQPKQFLNAHKLFGVSNIIKLLKGLDENQKLDAMKSIVFQANAREKDPVHGCVGIILSLRAQIDYLSHQLGLVRSQIMLYEQQHYQDVYNNMNSSNNHQLQAMANSGGIHANAAAASWMYPYTNSSSSLAPPAPPPYSTPDYDNAQVFHSMDFRRPDNNSSKMQQHQLEFHRRQQHYSDSKESYESSAESSIKIEGHSLDHSTVAEHELRSAAALFPLSSQN